MLVESLVRFALLGSTWVLYLLLALSVVSFAAMFERFLFFRRNRTGGQGLREQLKRAVVAGDEAAVGQVLSKSTAIEAAALREAFEFRDGGPSAFGDALESAIGKARGDLERSMTLLGTLGNNAPFVGLFGTVLGVIEAFSHLGSGDDQAMTGVMAGIAEALVATGVGIFVAIPAVVAYNNAQKRIGEIEGDAQSLVKLVTAFVKARENPAFEGPRGAEAAHEVAKRGEREDSGRIELTNGREAAAAGGE